MATILEQLAQSSSAGGVADALQSQTGGLASVGSALQTLIAHPPDSVSGFGDAVRELPLPDLDGGSSLVAGLGSLQGALPSDLSSVTGPLTSGLGSLGTTLGSMTGLLGNALAAVAAVRELASIDFRCASPASNGGGGAGAGAPAGGGAAGGAGGGGGGAPAGGGGGAGGGGAGAPPAAPPAATPGATAALDQISGALDLIPDTLDVATLLELLAKLLEFPKRDSLFPAVVPLLDDLRDPLLTLVAWKNMSATAVRTNVATTVSAAAELVDQRIDRALAPIGSELTALTPDLPTAVLGTATVGILTRLAELRTAVAGGDVSGTGPAVTALNGFLDDLDAARTAFATQVTPPLPALLEELDDLDGRLEDALVDIVSALAPSPALGFIEPLSKFLLDNAAANPVGEFQQWLGTFTSWLQDLVGALDLSAVEGPLQSVADEAHTILDAFDAAIAGVTVTVQQLFQELQDLIDTVDVAAAVNALQSQVHDFETTLEESLNGLFAPARDAIHSAVTTVDGAIDEFDPQQITDALQGLIDELESILGGAADLVAEIGETLQGVADQVSNVSFAPIIDEVVKAVDEVADLLRGIDSASLSPPLQIALQAALAILPQDLDPVIDELVSGFDDAVNSSAIPALDMVRAEPQKLLDEVKKYEPATLIGDELSQPFEALVGELEAFTPSSLLDPVKTELSSLEERIGAALDPAQVLAPIEGPFQELVSAYDSLRPDAIIEPIEGAINEAIAGVMESLPIGDALAAIDEVVTKLQEAVGLGDRVVAVLQRGQQLLSGFEGAPGQTSAWLDAILSKVDAAGAHNSLAAPLAALTTAIDGTQAAPLTSRIDTAVDAVLGPLTALDPHGKLSALAVAKNKISVGALDAIPDSAQKTALVAALARLDPLSPEFAAPFESLRDLATGLAAAKASTHSLLDAAWDANYTGPDGALHDLHGLTVGPQLGQSVREVVNGTLAGPLNGLFALAAPAATAVDALLTEVKKVVDELDAKIGSLVSGPGSLGDIMDSVQGLVDRLSSVDLGFLTDSLNEIFTDVREKLEALDPVAIAAPLAADVEALLSKLSLDLLIPQADLDELDATYKGVIDKLKALDPKKLVTDILQPAFDETVPPLLAAFDLSPVLDALVDKLNGLKDELKQELEKVNESYKQMLASAPSMDLGDIAGAAAEALGDVAGAVGIGL